MNSFYSRFDTHGLRSVIDIISPTKTCGKLHIEENGVLRVSQCANVPKRSGPAGISCQVLCHSDVWYLSLHLSCLS